MMILDENVVIPFSEISMEHFMLEWNFVLRYPFFQNQI